MNRRLLLQSCAALGLLSVLPPLRAEASAGVGAAAPAAFDPQGFKTLTTSITTDKGAVRVTYRFWSSVVYVGAPVDAAYQSMNISVPVQIDGQDVDASTAPVLFANAVGGYMPSMTAGAPGVGERSPDAQMPVMPPAADGAAPTFSSAMMARGEQVSLPKLGLAAGFVVVEPGARGRTLVNAEDDYYGVAPAAIVDLKAALRFLQANRGVIPGNMDRIVSTGSSAGGALSALLGASGNSPDYDALLAEVGAAQGSDAVFAAGCWCPITDLDHADMAYEWNWGANPYDGAPVDAALSGELAQGFAPYQAGLGLTTGDGQPLTADNYADHLLDAFIRPDASATLAAMDEATRSAYLAAHPHIGWQNGQAVLDWPGFLAHVGTRKKSLPAFDAFDLSAGENNLFGRDKVPARHFTNWSLRQASGDPQAVIDADLPRTLELMNPMPYLAAENPGRARHWWLRVGTSDTDTSLTVVGNLDAQARKLGDAVDTRLYWDQGHGANIDAAAFIDWMRQITA
ncbi:MAG: subtype B tannase [Paracoccus sp. (in: a-proteobacteria)]|uniref:subtype B tannase n=1 Tax=Paracoccus sp. TaxID=267 RepID=UPI0026DFAA4F|nr:subtype B tannase [Paracoccus sp. (in: a-proteobacteria)]MDO5620973.1 subtype B tannase [Paracoccus sp. (in: a-proteobacteria)]